MEIWKAVDGWTGYEISSEGRLRSWLRRPHESAPPKTPRVLVGGTDKDGYRRAVLTRYIEKGVQKKSMRIAQLVAAAFLRPRPKGTVLTHDNGQCTDNRRENLVWKTQKENIRDKWRHNTMAQGSRHGSSKLTEKEVRNIRASTQRTAILAQQYGVDRGTIHAIQTRKTWKWLK